MKKNFFFAGKKAKKVAFLGLLAIGILGLFWKTAPEKFSADLFSFGQKTAAAEIFIPNDLFAGQNAIGEIPVFAGEDFPFSARSDTIGFSFDLSFPADKMEFLGATKSGTLFDDPKFAENVLFTPGQNAVHFEVLTTDPTGVAIAPKNLLAKINFRMRENAHLGEQFSLKISNASLAYDGGNPTNFSLQKIQNGVLTVGSLADPNLAANVSEDFFLEENILARAGKERLIAIKSATTQNLTGVAFDLFLPAEKATFLEITTAGTPLDGKHFEILTDQKSENHIGILAATGELGGAAVLPDDPIFFVRILPAENLADGAKIPLQIRKMHTTDENLSLHENSVRDGLVTISSASTLKMVGVEPISPTAISVIFNDEIVAADISDFELSPNLKNAGSTAEISGKTVTLKNLDPMAENQIYRLDGKNTIAGNVGGTLDSSGNFAFFRGFSNFQNAASDFYIEKITATSDTSAEILFSKKVNPASIEVSDFFIPGISVISATADDQKITLETSSQSAISGSNFFTIQNQNPASDLISVDGELLSLNIAAFTPFGADSAGPKIISATAESPDAVKIVFDKPLLGSSIAPINFEIVPDGGAGNLIGGATTFELSADHTTIFLKNVPTVAGEKYRLTISPNTIRENSSAQNPITTVGNIATFLGQKSFSSPFDFVVVSAESTASDAVKITLSNSIKDAEISPLDVEIFSVDELGKTEKLTVSSAEISGKTIIVKTAAQIPEKNYFVLLNPEKFKSETGEKLGAISGKSFRGFFAAKMRATKVSPDQIKMGETAEIEISGVHFPAGSKVFLGKNELLILSFSENKIRAEISNSSETGIFDVVVVAPNGDETRVENAVNIFDPDLEEKLKPVVLSTESYATPFRVPNDGVTKTTLWVRVKDPRGVSDIEKVSLDLRALDGAAAAKMNLDTIVDNSAWYALEITVPPTVSTSADPIEIPVTLENKTGRKAHGTVSVMVSRDTLQSLPPEIRKAVASPAQVAPGDETPVTFQAEISDPDGAEDIARVVVDASAIGLGIKVLPPLAEIRQDEECNRSDYVVGEWSACVNGTQTRTVELKSGVECTEVADKKPIHEQSCSERSCTASDWEAKEWSACVNGKQTREYQKKPDAFCVGDNTKPAPETRDCSTTTGFLKNFFFPTATAASIYGNTIWFQSSELTVPKWVAEGAYDLPMTVIDREGTETTGLIHLEVRRDGSFAPKINKDEIYVAPRATIPNDEKTEFQIFVRVTDPNGIDDISAVTANLAPLGLKPTAMKKGQIDGDGAWFSTEKLKIPRETIKGFREIEISATDKNGNRATGGVTFYVSEPGEDGDGPKIPVDRAYSNPRTFLNDGQTTGTIYVFVEEGDAPIAHVSANLGTIGKYIDPEKVLAKKKNADQKVAFFENLFQNFAHAAENSENSNPNSENSNPKNQNLDNSNSKKFKCENNENLVCLTPSVAEGGTGKWYLLPHFAIQKNVEPSQNPYFISIVATDTAGRKTEAEIPVLVSDGTLPLAGNDLPHLTAAIATDHNRVEVIFSNPLDVKRISRDAFKIVFFDDQKTRFPIRDLDVRADGRAVTLTTNSMLAGDKLMLIVDAKKLGLKNSRAGDDRVAFDAFSKNLAAKSFEIASVKSISPKAVKIVFNKNIGFKSLFADGSNFKISEKGGSVDLPVRGAQLGDDGKTVILSTGVQRAGLDYILRADDLVDFAGNKLRFGSKIKVFTGFENHDELLNIFNQADFNRDGKVDFLDFSIFSTVYGTTGTTLPDDATSDLNGDGKIDFLDFTVFAQQYGEKIAADEKSKKSPEQKNLSPKK